MFFFFVKVEGVEADVIVIFNNCRCFIFIPILGWLSRRVDLWLIYKLTKVINKVFIIRALDPTKFIESSPCLQNENSLSNLFAKLSFSLFCFGEFLRYFYEPRLL